MPTRTPLPTPSPEEWKSIQAYAADKAGGPGAIYVGDLGQLVGPGPDSSLGNTYDPVPLDELENHRFVYESPYYQGLIRRARLDDPTPMTSRLRAPIQIQYVCINRALPQCDLVQHFFVPNLEARTDGLLEINVVSFAELGIAGPDTIQLLSTRVLDMAEVFPAYVSGDVPEMDVFNLYGLYEERSQAFEASADLVPITSATMAERTVGYPLYVSWHNGNDLYFFSRRPLYTTEDMPGLKTRSFNSPLSAWLDGMGAAPTFLAFAEVYSALERQNIDAAITYADAAFGQRWYEVSGYIAGPVVSWPVSHNVINGEVWDSIPRDLQEIMKEEAAKLELEALRLAAVQNHARLENLLDAGLEFIEFSPEMRWASQRAALDFVIPNWVEPHGRPIGTVRGSVQPHPRASDGCTNRTRRYGGEDALGENKSVATS